MKNLHRFISVILSDILVIYNIRRRVLTKIFAGKK